MDTYLVYLLVTVLPNTINLITLLIVISSLSILMLLILTAVLQDCLSSEIRNAKYHNKGEDKITELSKDKGELWVKCYKNCKALVILTLVLLTLKVFLPTGKEIIMIAGGSYVLNNEEISKLPTNTAKAVNTFLEEYTNTIEETGKDGQ